LYRGVVPGTAPAETPAARGVAAPAMTSEAVRGGTGRIHDARTGDQLWSRQFTTETTFLNDVVVTRSAAYFTDSHRAVLYVVPGPSLDP